jgi:hypothetical protein
MTAVLGPTSVVVVTEFECDSRRACLGVWLRFMLGTRAIRRVASGLTFSGTTVSWRDRRVVSVSGWEATESVYSLGWSRRHVEAVRWAIRHTGIRTRSVLFESAGDWRQVLLRDRRRSKTPVGKGEEG